MPDRLMRLSYMTHEHCAPCYMYIAISCSFLLGGLHRRLFTQMGTSRVAAGNGPGPGGLN
jgi:hypothetical protein